MAGYREASNGIARQVGAGELEPGTELWSVREHAARLGVTASTISRAHRCLAEHGVIVLGHRRRARVAAGGRLAAARFLEPGRVFRLAGSDDPAWQAVLGRVPGQVVTVGTRGSFPGIRALARGDADGAAVHLLHRSGVYNAPFAMALLRGRGPTLIHLWRREQGLIVPPGNPDGITDPAHLRGRRVAKRETGAGTRVLLDRLLIDAGVPPEDVPGPDFGSHLEIALAVASGICDAGLGLRAAATDLDLEFVPLTWEHYDLVLGAEALAAAAGLIGVLRDRVVRAAISGLGGYDPSRAGDVTSL